MGHGIRSCSYMSIDHSSILAHNCCLEEQHGPHPVFDEEGPHSSLICMNAIKVYYGLRMLMQCSGLLHADCGGGGCAKQCESGQKCR